MSNSCGVGSSQNKKVNTRWNTRVEWFIRAAEAGMYAPGSTDVHSFSSPVARKLCEACDIHYYSHYLRLVRFHVECRGPHVLQ